VGREAYIRRITERLTTGITCCSPDPRRIGKTSLILEVLRVSGVRAR
jgi:AAA+ ATPase superfamily predicted ATPase